MRGPDGGVHRYTGSSHRELTSSLEKKKPERTVTSQFCRRSTNQIPAGKEKYRNFGLEARRWSGRHETSRGERASEGTREVERADRMGAGACQASTGPSPLAGRAPSRTTRRSLSCSAGSSQPTVRMLIWAGPARISLARSRPCSSGGGEPSGARQDRA